MGSISKRNRTIVVEKTTFYHQYGKVFDAANEIWLKTFILLLQGITRFVPNITKAKINKSYQVPQEEGGYRYHIHLIDANGTVILFCKYFYKLLSLQTQQTSAAM